MASVILRTGFEKVKHMIPFTKGTLVKGEKLAFCHIKNVEEYVDNNINNRIIAKCIRQTSVTETPYKLELEVNDDRQVIRVQCTCIAKETGECKHIAALIHRINNDRSVSKTSVKQEWGFPSINHFAKEKYSRGATLDELFPQKVLKNPPQPLNFTEEDFTNIECPVKKRVKLDFISEEEQVCILIMNTSLVEREVEILFQCTKEIIANLLIAASRQSMIGRYGIAVHSKMAQYYHKFVVLTNENIFNLCLRTTQQSETEEWFEARRIRITASKKAHQIKTMTRKPVESLLKEFLNPKIVKTESLSYGIKNEEKARDNYKIERDVYVFKVGIFVSPIQPWLGVSVDGVVVSDGMIVKIVEIKCPISCQSKPIWNEETREFNVAFIEMSTDGVAQLKKNHIYYTQCQLQMYVTGITSCDIFVWSPRGSYVIEVPFDREFLVILIPKLEKFYFNNYLLALTNEEKEIEVIEE